MKRLLSIFLAALITLAPLNAFSTAQQVLLAEGGIPAPVLIDSSRLNGSGCTAQIAFGPAQNAYAGSGFAGANKTLNRIDVWIRNNSRTGNLVAQVYLATGTQGVSTLPTGGALATSAVASVNSISSSDPGGIASFDFSAAAYVMSAGTHYAFLVTNSSLSGYVFISGAGKAGSYPPDNAFQPGSPFNTIGICYGVYGS